LKQQPIAIKNDQENETSGVNADPGLLTCAPADPLMDLIVELVRISPMHVTDSSRPTTRASLFAWNRMALPYLAFSAMKFMKLIFAIG
jgi:hypothetical protein